MPCGLLPPYARIKIAWHIICWKPERCCLCWMLWWADPPLTLSGRFLVVHCYMVWAECIYLYLQTERIFPFSNKLDKRQVCDLLLIPFSSFAFIWKWGLQSFNTQPYSFDLMHVDCQWEDTKLILLNSKSIPGMFRVIFNFWRLLWPF